MRVSFEREANLDIMHVKIVDVLRRHVDVTISFKRDIGRYHFKYTMWII